LDEIAAVIHYRPDSEDGLGKKLPMIRLTSNVRIARSTQFQRKKRLLDPRCAKSTPIGSRRGRPELRELPGLDERRTIPVLRSDATGAARPTAFTMNPRIEAIGGQAAISGDGQPDIVVARWVPGGALEG
jgi:hypothetical protein